MQEKGFLFVDGVNRSKIFKNGENPIALTDQRTNIVQTLINNSAWRHCKAWDEFLIDSDLKVGPLKQRDK